MAKKLLFLGDSGSLLSQIMKQQAVELSGVVADSLAQKESRYFGSAYSLAKKADVPVIGQKRFRDGYKKYLSKLFKDIDMIFIHGYRYRITNDLINNDRFKIVNFHQSLLPDYGGRHPLNWAIINGEKEIGLTNISIKDL